MDFPLIPFWKKQTGQMKRGYYSLEHSCLIFSDGACRFTKK
jgi:hypothetical protein